MLMRKDMHKIVIDTYRVNGYFDGNKKHGKRVNADYDEDGLYGRISSSRRRQYSYDCKDLGDRISPLRKYLRSCVGRHWDDVYSELKKGLPRGLHGEHIWSHVQWEIDIHCFEGQDGKIHRMGHRNFGYNSEVDGLFVHPKTRRVCWAEPKNTESRRRRKAKARNDKAIEAGEVPVTIDGKSYCKYDGIWYLVWRETEERYVPGLDKTVEIKTYHKRQISRKELKATGLTNAA